MTGDEVVSLSQISAPCDKCKSQSHENKSDLRVRIWFQGKCISQSHFLLTHLRNSIYPFMPHLHSCTSTACTSITTTTTIPNTRFLRPPTALKLNHQGQSALGYFEYSIYLIPRENFDFNICLYIIYAWMPYVHRTSYTSQPTQPARRLFFVICPRSPPACVCNAVLFIRVSWMLDAGYWLLVLT